MDNRIPPVIKDFIKNEKPDEIEGLNHLSFTDWICNKEHLHSDWTIVARTNKKIDNEFYTISCFATPPNVETRNILFTQYTWEINSDFGIPYMNGSITENWEYSEHPECQIGNVTLKPFIIRRSFHSYIPKRFEVIQHFLLYYEAFWAEEKREYQSVEENGEIITIIKHIKNSEEDEIILVNTKYLRNYLALTKSYLVRFHDHIRRYIKPMPFKSNNASYSDEKCSYQIDIYNANYVEGFMSHSRLLGKDIINPFDEPLARFTFETSEKDYVNFIIGTDINGNNIECTCNENYLSNYFTDKGTPNILTPVYFNKTVLLKYYSEPKRFEVTSHHISCLSLWGIHIDITKEGLVQVWLGDIGKIPHNEQLHWKQYNVQPRGTISKYRFETDFEAKFSSPTVEESPIQYLKSVYNELNEKARTRFAENIFLKLEESDQHYLKILRIPLTEEWKEFDELVQALAKIFCDSINVKLLETISGQKIDNKIIKGSISLLYATLEKLGVENEKINITIETLQAIQAIRSTGAAHRKGKKFVQSLEKYKLINLTNEDKIKRLTINLYYGLQAVIDHIQITTNGDTKH